MGRGLAGGDYSAHPDSLAGGEGLAVPPKNSTLPRSFGPRLNIYPFLEKSYGRPCSRYDDDDDNDDDDEVTVVAGGGDGYSC